MATQRTVLKLLGGGTVVAAAGLGGYLTLGGHSVSARAPWRLAGEYEDLRMRALSYAILAPNPHNMQPWQVRLDSQDSFLLYCNAKRRLPATDPYSRQITIGFGTFLEQFRLAAAQEGAATHITPFPEGETMTSLDDRPIAHVRLESDAAEPDPLFLNILDRRSNREVYKGIDVEPDKLNLISEAASIETVSAKTIGNTSLARQLRELTWQAHSREMLTQDALMETVKVMQIGKTAVSKNPYGLAFDDPTMSAMSLVGLMSRKAMANPESTAFKEGMKMFRKRAMSARAFGWLTNPNTSRAMQLDAGRAYARLNLQATKLGLAIHPWSQALQEYPEMSDLYKQVHDLIGHGQTVQMLVRIGYAPDVIAAPRQKLDTFIVDEKNT